MTFACQFSNYRYKRLPFQVASAGGMFQRKKYEIFKDYQMYLVLQIDILVVGYVADGNDHDDTLQIVLQR